MLGGRSAWSPPERLENTECSILISSTNIVLVDLPFVELAETDQGAVSVVGI